MAERRHMVERLAVSHYKSTFVFVLFMFYYAFAFPQSVGSQRFGELARGLDGVYVSRVWIAFSSVDLRRLRWATK